MPKHLFQVNYTPQGAQRLPKEGGTSLRTLEETLNPFMAYWASFWADGDGQQ